MDKRPYTLPPDTEVECAWCRADEHEACQMLRVAEPCDCPCRTVEKGS